MLANAFCATICTLLSISIAVVIWALIALISIKAGATDFVAMMIATGVVFVPLSIACMCCVRGTLAELPEKVIIRVDPS